MASMWITLEIERLLYVNRGRDVILLDRGGSQTIIVKLSNPQSEVLRNNSAAKVTTPDANTHGQTGIAATRDRSRCRASRKALAKLGEAKAVRKPDRNAGLRFDDKNDDESK